MSRIDLDAWFTTSAALLRELTAIDLGYPQGDNVVRPPAPDAAAVLARLGVAPDSDFAAFYRRADGLCWMDVHNGLNLHALALIERHADGSGPVTVVEDPLAGPVLAFGTDGGGAWFVLQRATGRVLRLGYGYFDEQGAWRPSPGTTRVLAEDFAGFLVRVQADLRAFVGDVHEHDWLT